MRNKRYRSAFTLVELLVVIAIIALLMAILLPALSRARYIAKLTVDTSNLKQVGTLVAAYQADNEGLVPVLANRFTPIAAGWPAKSRLLSVALYRYSPETRNLPSVTDTDSGVSGLFKPDNDWGNSQDTVIKPKYFKRFLPKIYVCPFVSGKKATPGRDFVQGPTLTMNGTPVNTMIRTAAGESYVTWRWELERDKAYSPGHPLGLPNGTPKFGALSWNVSSQLGDYAATYSKLASSPVLWNRANLMRIKAPSMAEATILYCEQGQSDSWMMQNNPDNGIYNYGSHMRFGKGGTNVLMADTHVEWVEGTRVGWP